MKLYKYRSIRTEIFPKYLESLREGYLWFADVLSLNDKSDSIVYYGKEQEYNEFKQYFDEHKLENVLTILDRFVPDQKIKDCLLKVPKDTMLEMISILEKTDNEKSDYLISKGETKENIDKFFEKYSPMKSFMDMKEHELVEKMKPIVNFNSELRKKIKIFSVSESYDIPSLWGTYADGNRGFCIEYDFSKTNEGNLLDNLRKVIYVDERKALPYIDLFESLIYGEDAKGKITNIFEEQLLSKDSSWSPEREWRVVIADHENKYYADLVTAIYIDELIEHSSEAQAIINLSKIKGWKIFIRRLEDNYATYSYAEL